MRTIVISRKPQDVCRQARLPRQPQAMTNQQLNDARTFDHWPVPRNTQQLLRAQPAPYRPRFIPEAQKELQLHCGNRTSMLEARLKQCSRKIRIAHQWNEKPGHKEWVLDFNNNNMRKWQYKYQFTTLLPLCTYSNPYSYDFVYILKRIIDDLSMQI